MSFIATSIKYVNYVVLSFLQKKKNIAYFQANSTKTTFLQIMMMVIQEDKEARTISNNVRA